MRPSTISPSLQQQDPHLSTRITLTRELKLLHDLILDVGKDSATMLSLLISSLLIESEFISEKLAQYNQSTTEKIAQTELQAISILTLQQPLLKDLRFVLGCLRISDHQLRLTKHIIKFQQNGTLIENKDCIPAELKSAAENSHLMLQDTLKAFEFGSSNMAQKVIAKEREIDLLHDLAWKTLLLRLNQDAPDKIELDAQLLSLVRLLERIVDAITSIAKEVYFIHAGRRV